LTFRRGSNVKDKPVGFVVVIVAGKVNLWCYLKYF
jgi:hypothetical protein